MLKWKITSQREHHSRRLQQRDFFKSTATTKYCLSSSHVRKITIVSCRKTVCVPVDSERCARREVAMANLDQTRQRAKRIMITTCSSSWWTREHDGLSFYLSEQKGASEMVLCDRRRGTKRKRKESMTSTCGWKVRRFLWTDGYTKVPWLKGGFFLFTKMNF